MSALSTFFDWLDFRRWITWLPQSDHYLDSLESKLLSDVGVPLHSRYVAIRNGTERIWTIIANPDQQGIPLVMIHGLCAGVATWALNIDQISRTSPLYMLDLIGFGKSSRPLFSDDPDTIETQFVDSLEEWRSEMNLDRFVLLGHSLGAFITTAYILKYPERVQHLILVDAWGVLERPEGIKISLKMYIKKWAYRVMNINPFSIIRAVGPWGLKLLKTVRSDVSANFSHMMRGDLLLEYIYHCNIQNPSGELAFVNMSHSFMWAKRPMIGRADEINPDLPITMIHGSKSWISLDTCQKFKALRRGAYVDIQVVEDGTHLVFANKHEEFNSIVKRICEKLNSNLAVADVTTTN